MYEFHAWFGLYETTEEPDIGGLRRAIEGLKQMLSALNWPGEVVAEVRNLHSDDYLWMHGNVRRPGFAADNIEAVVSELITKLPGSYGLIYDRDNEDPAPPGANNFRVRVLARGELVVRHDPFLSPAKPTIED